MNFKIGGRECENLGKIFTIKSTDKNELELVNKFTKADLKHGDKCTLKNGQVIFFDKTSKGARHKF